MLPQVAKKNDGSLFAGPTALSHSSLWFKDFNYWNKLPHDVILIKFYKKSLKNRRKHFREFLAFFFIF